MFSSNKKAWSGKNLVKYLFINSVSSVRLIDAAPNSSGLILKRSRRVPPYLPSNSPLLSPRQIILADNNNCGERRWRGCLFEPVQWSWSDIVIKILTRAIRLDKLSVTTDSKLDHTEDKMSRHSREMKTNLTAESGNKLKSEEQKCLPNIIVMLAQHWRHSDITIRTF